MKTLSSLRFMVISTSALVCWLIFGAVLGKTDAFRLVILRQMNNALIRDWILQEGTKNSIPCLWLIVLILIAGLLLVNMVFCTWNKLLNFGRGRARLSKILLLAVHILFFVIVLMHGISFIWGYKEKADLVENGTFSMPGDLMLKVDEIRFTDDPGMLRMDRHARTKDAFHWEENYVRVSLMQGEDVLLSRKLRHMAPIKFKGTQISLFKFSDLSPGNQRTGKKGGCRICGGHEDKPQKKITLQDVRPGVNLVFTRNPIGSAFFWIYGFFVLTTGCYLILLRSRKGEK